MPHSAPSWTVWLKLVGTFLLLSLDSILSHQEGLLSCLSCSLSLAPPVTKVAEVVTVVVAVDPGGVGGEDPVVAVAVEPIEVGDELASCWSSVVLCAFSFCCLVSIDTMVSIMAMSHAAKINIQKSLLLDKIKFLPEEYFCLFLLFVLNIFAVFIIVINTIHTAMCIIINTQIDICVSNTSDINLLFVLKYCETEIYGL